MNNDSTTPEPPAPSVTASAAAGDGLLTRERLKTVALLIATGLVIYLSYLLLKPFLAILAWALALAVIGMPMHRRIAIKVRRPGLAASLSVVAVAVVIVLPAAIIIHQIVSEALAGADFLQSEIATGNLRRQLMATPELASGILWIERNVDLQGIGQQVLGGISGIAQSIVTGSAWAVVGLLIVFLCLFYFFRDRSRFVGSVRSLLPLSMSESDRMLTRIRNTVRATVFGTLVVAAIQGTLGGLMFWWLGLPLPILWGTVMGLLAIIPVLGAFIIWIPAAIVLVIQGQVLEAVILTVWGSVVVGLVDNLLYPILVGGKLRLHSLLVFFSILGGLAVFGTSGLILGPLVLALADGLIDVWRARMQSIDDASDTPEPQFTPAAQAPAVGT